MSVGRPRRLAALVAAATLAATAAAVPGAPAHADEASDAPVTRNDRATVSGSSFEDSIRTIDVLANDRDPNGDELAICRVRIPQGAPLLVVASSDFLIEGSDEDETLLVLPTRNRSGTYTITYWACDYDYLTPATLTVTVKASPEIIARKLDKPGRVRFTNPTRGPAAVLYGSPAAGEPDNRIRVPAGESRVVRTPHRRLIWVAIRPRTGDFLGSGFVRGIRQRGRAQPTQPTQPTHSVSGRELLAWRAAR